MNAALETKSLVKSFGSLRVANDVSLTVAAGARHALIGPNGAGKTTLIDLLTGFLEPDAGQVLIDGEDATRLRQHERVRRGVVRTFQINRLFDDLTVLETVLMAVNERRGNGWRWWRPASACREAVAEAAALLERLRLLDVAHATTRNLAYGKRRLIEIALALALQPKILLLDEPAAGVPAAESRELFRFIAALPRDVTVLLIEHDMDLVFRFAERISVLVGGALLAEGAPTAIADDPRVREAYLGASSP